MSILFTTEQLLILEKQIGRKLDPVDRGKYSNLNDVPEELAQELRRLDWGFPALRLLSYYVTPGNRRFFKVFLSDVIGGGQSPKNWRRGDILVPDPSLADHLRMSRDAILQPIGGVASMRVAPSLPYWQKRLGSFLGTPALARPEKNYLTKSLPGTTTLGERPLEPIVDLEIALRRWLAFHVARYMKEPKAQSVEDLFAQSEQLSPQEEWSADARIAVAALLKEFQTFEDPFAGVPGFRGPDEWFRGT